MRCWLVADVQQEMREMEADSSPKQSTSGAAGDTGSECAVKGTLMFWFLRPLPFTRSFKVSLMFFYSSNTQFMATFVSLSSDCLILILMFSSFHIEFSFETVSSISCCASCRKKWGLAATGICPCGKCQVMSLIVNSLRTVQNEHKSASIPLCLHLS